MSYKYSYISTVIDLYNTYCLHINIVSCYIILKLSYQAIQDNKMASDRNFSLDISEIKETGSW